MLFAHGKEKNMMIDFHGENGYNISVANTIDAFW